MSGIEGEYCMFFRFVGCSSLEWFYPRLVFSDEIRWWIFILEYVVKVFGLNNLVLDNNLYFLDFM